MEKPETFESLWDYCTANGRAVPVPQRWNKLFEMLIEKRRLPSGGWNPALPLILAAWHVATPIQKQLRFKEHVLWADDHGQVVEVGRYLRSLNEEDWYHFGEL